MVQSKKVISLIVISLLSATYAHAEPRWTSVRGDGFEIVTDAAPSTAAKMAHRASHIRQLLGGTAKVLPLRVVLLADENLFTALRPSATVGGYYQSSADEDWIVVRWGLPDSERAMSHELVHAFMEHAGPRRPLWLEEGLAEFYSTVQLDPKGWTIGAPIPSHARSLNQRPWLGEREFFEAHPDSALREENARIGRFYAQSWAVVHYLLTNPAVREKSPDLFNALGSGTPFALACQQTLGQRQGLLLESARRAVEQGHFRTARIAATASEQIGPATTFPPEQAETMLVSLALASARPQLAQKFAKTPIQRALISISADPQQAEKLLEQAVKEGDANPAPYFELAMFLREQNREPERVAALLRQTIERNPNHAEAHFILGLRAAASGDTEGAIDYYQRAAQILPRQANFWHALALSLERANRLPEAAHAALRCRQAARNPTEREMAAAIERLVTVRPQPIQTAKDQIPEAWNGLKGDTSAQGTLTEFDCAARPPLALIDTGNGLLTLRVARPNLIKITGTGQVQHTLTCGKQNQKVSVEYIRSTNELTALSFPL